MSEAFLKRSVKKYFKAQGFKVSMRRIRLGNTEIDGEALGLEGERIAIEIKTAGDDLCRGLGQLSEAQAYGYDQGVLVTTLRKARKVNLTIFHYFEGTLRGVNSREEIHTVLS